jgi:2-polyprenyl-6-methoxyphenol hydroxylase-like FAD-dependent oxidoreductase
MGPLFVGVIGGGTAGAAAALFLARQGHRVTVYERVPDPKPVGAGITLQPTGQHVLHRLGLLEEVAARGARIDRLLCETPAGKPIVSLAYRTYGEGWFGLGLHRGVLFAALHAAVQASPDITLRTGVEIVDLERSADSGRAPVRRAGGRWLVDRHGDLQGPHDLVVVADGARSQLRDDTSTSKRVEPYPWGALWFVAHDPRPSDDPRASLLHQVCDGTQRFLGLLPTGRGPGDDAQERLVSLFWSVRADTVETFRRRGLGPWKDELRALRPGAGGVLEDVLDQIHDVDQILFAAYHDVVMHRWTTRDVVYLGDAAHATSPQLGQGANLALWDAMVLADAVAEEPRDLARALDRYSRAREAHLGFYQVATRWLTPFFQSDHTWLGPLRDLGMPLACRVPFAESVMTRSMLGVVSGWGLGSLALDDAVRSA